MAKKQVSELEKEIEKAIKEQKAVIGTNNVLRALRNKKLSKVYLSSNCPEEIKNDLNHYSKLLNITLVQTDKTNEELGILCKKPFFVAVLGIKA